MHVVKRALCKFCIQKKKHLRRHTRWLSLQQGSSSSVSKKFLNFLYNETNANRVSLVCTWSQQLPPPSQLIDRSVPILQASVRLRRVFERPLVSYRWPSNLRDLLVRTRPKQRNSRETAGTFPCDAARCKTCPLTKQAGIVPLPSPQGMFSCRSSNVVHAIICTACNAVYIGETGCLLRERMNGHRYSSKHKQDTPVAGHFRKKDHKMAVRVFQGAQEDVTMRRNLEKNG